MPYVLKNVLGEIIAISHSVDVLKNKEEHWQEVDVQSNDYLNFVDNTIAKDAPFRESDIQLARVLEDLINLLIEKETIRFTDLPEPAQKRLIERQSLRKKNRSLNIVDDNKELFY